MGHAVIHSIRTICLLIRNTSKPAVMLGYKKVGFGHGKFTGIGGKVEPGESIRDAAVRELSEEIGVFVQPDALEYTARLTFLFPHKTIWSQIDHVFLVPSWRGLPQEGREVRPEWFALGAIPYGQMWDDARFWLPQVLEGKHVRARFIFGLDNERVKEVLTEQQELDLNEVLQPPWREDNG